MNVWVLNINEHRKLRYFLLFDLLVLKFVYCKNTPI